MKYLFLIIGLMLGALQAVAADTTPAQSCLKNCAGLSGSQLANCQIDCEIEG